MGLSAPEWYAAAELAITELATAAGVEITDAKTPGLAAMARMVSERRQWWEYESTRGQREADQRDDDWRRAAADVRAQAAVDATRHAQLVKASGGRLERSLR